jgi:hypothetical protein
MYFVKLLYRSLNMFDLAPLSSNFERNQYSFRIIIIHLIAWSILKFKGFVGRSTSDPIITNWITSTHKRSDFWTIFMYFTCCE